MITFARRTAVLSAGLVLLVAACDRSGPAEALTSAESGQEMEDVQPFGATASTLDADTAVPPVPLLSDPVVAPLRQDPSPAVRRLSDL